MPPIHLPHARLILLAGGLFALSSLPVALWNLPLFSLINGNNSAFADQFFGLVSGLGDGLVSVVLILLAALYYPRIALAALLAFLLSGGIAQLLKHIFDMPRPPVVLGQVHLLGAPLGSHTFPSGHATTDGVMASAALLLWRDKHRWTGRCVAAIFLLAALGRVYGGVHFPLDIWVGLAIGITTFLLCHQWSQRWPLARWQASRHWTPLLGLLLAATASVLGLGYHVQPATAQPLALMVPLISLFLLTRHWRATP